MTEQVKHRAGWHKWEDLTPDEKQQVFFRYHLHVSGPEAYAYWLEAIEGGHTSVYVRRPLGAVRNWRAKTPYDA